MKRLSIALVMALCIMLLPTTAFSDTETFYHREFTQDNTLNIHRGMTPREIIEIFGKPDQVSTQTWGTQTKKPWVALVYVYRMKKETFGEAGDVWIDSENNTFAFDTETNKLVYWEINTTY